LDARVEAWYQAKIEACEEPIVREMAKRPDRVDVKLKPLPARTPGRSASRDRLANALRLAATSLEHRSSALGGFYRRMKARLGAAEAVPATAHKLARILYRLLKHGEAYVRTGLEDYERKFQARRVRALEKTAKLMGYELVKKQPVPSGVS